MIERDIYRERDRESRIRGERERKRKEREIETSPDKLHSYPAVMKGLFTNHNISLNLSPDALVLSILDREEDLTRRVLLCVITIVAFPLSVVLILYSVRRFTRFLTNSVWLSKGTLVIALRSIPIQLINKPLKKHLFWKDSELTELNYRSRQASSVQSPLLNEPLRTTDKEWKDNERKIKKKKDLA